MIDAASDRLSRLSGFLEQDPENPTLLADTVQAALDANALSLADTLVSRLRLIRPDAFDGKYLAAVAAMRRNDFSSAAAILRPLVETDGNPNVRFNLAWCEAMLGNKPVARELLNESTINAIAAAAMLKTQILHEAGDFAAALDAGKAALEIFPDDSGLLAAVATLALDAEDPVLARACAMRAGDHPEALAAAGVLDLQDGHPDIARVLFDRSLSIRTHNPRAWIGRGLTALLAQDVPDAARDIDRGAQQFGDHIGSWIAAGWAHYLAGDIGGARQRFERALAIDPNFAEAQGSLAVVALAEGNKETARRAMVIALRLDRDCFSAALAGILMTSDDPAKSQEIVARAMATPLNGNGLTIANYMSGLSRTTVH